jgi:hypothetical protein
MNYRLLFALAQAYTHSLDVKLLLRDATILAMAHLASIGCNPSANSRVCWNV